MLPFVYTFYRFFRGVRIGLKDPEFQVLMSLAAITIATGTLFYHDIEGWTWLNSVYFSVTTLATVGFGDLAPHTDAGKIFTMVYIFVGIGVFLGLINAAADHAIRESRQNPGIIARRLFGHRPEPVQKERELTS